MENTMGASKNVGSGTGAGISNVTSLSDKELLGLCKEYGREALQWKWKFAGLLPEVSRRGLWREAGFESIFHFSKVLGGMSEAQVKQALRLERKFENLPMLQELFHEGVVSPNKLDRIGAVVTEENEEEAVEAVTTLSNRAIEVMVRDEKTAQVKKTPQKSLHVQNSVEADGHALFELELSEELKARLLKLKEKGFDVNVLLMELLDAREEMIKEEKEAIAEEIEMQEKLEQEIWRGCHPREIYGMSKKEKAQRRYINARTKRLIQAEHGTKCSINGCNELATELHHTRRFSLAPNHNPKFLAPLCKAHHELAARVDVRYLQCKSKKTSISFPSATQARLQ